MYNNHFQRTNPGLFVFLLDQSGSMEDLMPDNGKALDVNAADAINSVINEMILKLTVTDANGEDLVKRSSFISVIGYGGKGDGYGNKYDYEAETITDGWIDEIAELPQAKSLLDGTTDLVQVVTPIHGGGTPMASAFDAAKSLVEAWIQTHNTANDPAPIIINITDGEPTDSVTDLKRIVSEIKAMNVPDGAPLIFNIHLTAAKNVSIVEYPSDIAVCADDASKLLYEISSEAHPDLISTIQELQAKGLQGGEKLLISNVSKPEKITEFLKIGTPQNKLN